jgi:hypothetical protein
MPAKFQKLSTLCGAYEPKWAAPKSGAEQLRHKCGKVSKLHEVQLLNPTRKFRAELVGRGSADKLQVAASARAGGGAAPT